VLLHAIETSDLAYPPPAPPPPSPPRPPDALSPPPPPPYSCQLPASYRPAPDQFGRVPYCFNWDPLDSWPYSFMHGDMYEAASCPSSYGPATRKMQWEKTFRQPAITTTASEIDEEVQPTGSPFPLCSAAGVNDIECCRVAVDFTLTQTYEAYSKIPQNHTLDCETECGARVSRPSVDNNCVP